MHDRVIISVAPVGENRKSYAPSDIANEVIRCKRKGASIVHLHVRDELGRLTDKIDVFNETVKRIKDAEDIIIEGSTGGLSNLDPIQRSVCLKNPFVEIASLNLGSINLGESVYVNKASDIRFWASLIRERGVLPQLEIFDLSMIYTAKKLIEMGLIDNRAIFTICLGFDFALPAIPETLVKMYQALPEEVRWGLTHHNMSNFKLISAGIGLGATIVRVGQEDTLDSSISNETLVENLSILIEHLGLKVATPEEARIILGIKG